MKTSPLYNSIGKGYDTTRKADPEIVSRIVSLLSPPIGGKILDLACGTGNYTSALSQLGLSLVGVDQSSEMLNKARLKPVEVEWVEASAEKLTFSSAAFSGAVCTFAVYLFKDIGPVFSEISRVLDKGKFVLFTFTPEQVRGYWLNEYFPVTMQRVADKMLSLEILSDALKKSGFKKVLAHPYQVPTHVEDAFLYSAKHRPEAYLDANFRMGISAFVLHGDEAEIAIGCRRLAGDIRTGHIDSVLKNYPSPLGDCLFVVAEKV